MASYDVASYICPALLPATVVCTNSHVMVKALQAVTTGIPSLTRVLRLKNKLAELKKPLNLHFNLVFQPPDSTPVTVEIQFMHEAGPARNCSKHPSTQVNLSSLQFNAICHDVLSVFC
jgi:hypothetical protein